MRSCHNSYTSFLLTSPNTNQDTEKIEIACQNIRFSTLFAAGDVSRETS